MSDIDELVESARLRALLPEPSERRRLREVAGLSQQELADYCGVDRVSISRWERGEHEPRGEQRERYCDLLSRLAAVVAA